MQRDTVHTYPANDVVEHATDGSDCICGPTPEMVRQADGGYAWHAIHHSLDGREFRERGEEIPREVTPDA